MKLLRELIKGFVLRTNRYPWFRRKYESFYRYSLRKIVDTLKTFDVVLSIYAKGGSRDDVGWPGSSDIDLIVVTKTQSPNDGFQSELRFQDAYRRLQRRFPVLNDYKTLTADEFAAYCRVKSIRHPVTVREKTRLIHGANTVPALVERTLGAADKYAVLKEICVQINDHALLSPNNRHVRYPINSFERFRTAIACLPRRGEAAIAAPTNASIARVVADDFFVNDPQEFTLGLWDETLRNIDLLDHGNASLAWPTGTAPTERHSRPFTLCSADIPPPSRSRVLAALASFVSRVSTVPGVARLLVGSNWSCGYQYDVWVLTRWEPNGADRRACLREIRSAYVNEQENFQNALLQQPLVMPQSFFETYVRQLIEPGEALYLSRHGRSLIDAHPCVAIDPHDALAQLGRLDPVAFAGAFLSGPPIGGNFFELMNHHLDRGNWRMVVHLLDLILGNIPAKRLLLEAGVFATAPHETLSDYRAAFRSDSEISAYPALHALLYDAFPGPDILPFVRSNRENIYRFLRTNTASILRAVPDALGRSGTVR